MSLTYVKSKLRHILLRSLDEVVISLNREVIPTLAELVRRFNELTLDDFGSGVTLVSVSGNVTAEASQFIDYEAPVTTSYTVTLPAAPTASDLIYVKAPPNATRYPLSVSGNGKNIDGYYTSATSFSMDLNNMSIGLFYNGTRWRIF